MPNAARRWCLFTSAGDRNAIRRWLGGGAPRRWDLVVAYYGDSENEYAEISRPASYAFRQKGRRCQNFLRERKHVCAVGHELRLAHANDRDRIFAI
jgi:hypothetical protein